MYGPQRFQQQPLSSVNSASLPVGFTQAQKDMIQIRTRKNLAILENKGKEINGHRDSIDSVAALIHCRLFGALWKSDSFKHSRKWDKAQLRTQATFPTPFQVLPCPWHCHERHGLPNIFSSVTVIFSPAHPQRWTISQNGALLKVSCPKDYLFEIEKLESYLKLLVLKPTNHIPQVLEYFLRYSGSHTRWWTPAPQSLKTQRSVSAVVSMVWPKCLTDDFHMHLYLIQFLTNQTKP